MTYRYLTTPRVQVAAEIRRLRVDGGVTREAAADALGCTTSKIGDVETGRSNPKPAELEKLLELYKAPHEARGELLASARAGQKRRPRGTHLDADVPATLRRVIDLEAQATGAMYYSGETVPALLQVPRYAEAVLTASGLATEGCAAAFVELQVGRHQNLTRTGSPLQYLCVLGEAALRSGVGGPEVMREQLHHLAQTSQTQPNVTVRVLQLGSGCHPFLGLTTTLLYFPHPAPSVVATAEHQRDVFHDRPEVVAPIELRFRATTAKALSAGDSTALIDDTLRQL
jgi:transcriptional regulator with XRE-family HTH domain